MEQKLWLRGSRRRFEQLTSNVERSRHGKQRRDAVKWRSFFHGLGRYGRVQARERAVGPSQHFGAALDLAAVVSEHEPRRPVHEAAVDRLLGRLYHFACQAAEVFGGC